MENGGFNPESALIGGMAILSVHLIIMSWIRKLGPDWKLLDKYFDVLNVPVGLLLVALVTPPWPVFSGDAWRDWFANGLALGAAASVAAGKVITADKKKAESEGREYKARSQTEVYSEAADQVREELKRERQKLES